MGVPHVFLAKLSANIVAEIYCLTSFQLLAKGAIDRLPVLVPRCYANPGLTSKLFEEKMSILSENTLKFYKADPTFFDVDHRKAGALAKAIQSKPAPTIITNKDARLTLINKRGGQRSTSCSWNNDDHQSSPEFPTQIFTNSSWISLPLPGIGSKHLNH